MLRRMSMVCLRRKSDLKQVVVDEHAQWHFGFVEHQISDSFAEFISADTCKPTQSDWHNGLGESDWLGMRASSDRDAVRRSPRARASGEHLDGLWRTGRPDDPRRGKPDRTRRGSQSSAVPHSPNPRAKAPSGICNIILYCRTGAREEGPPAQLWRRLFDERFPPEQGNTPVSQASTNPGADDARTWQNPDQGIHGSRGQQLRRRHRAREPPRGGRGHRGARPRHGSGRPCPPRRRPITQRVVYGRIQSLATKASSKQTPRSTSPIGRSPRSPRRWGTPEGRRA